MASPQQSRRPQQPMAELDCRFHGLPPLKRFKMLQKEKFELLPPAIPPSRMVQVRCLPAKKRVCALDFLHLVSEDASEDKENEPDLKMGGLGFSPAPQWTIDSDPSFKPSKVSHGNVQALSPLKPNRQIHPVQQRKSPEKYDKITPAEKMSREAAENITPPKKRARFSKENCVPSGKSQQSNTKPRTKYWEEKQVSEKASEESAGSSKECPKGKDQNSTEVKACIRNSGENSKKKKKSDLDANAESVHGTECKDMSSKKKADSYQSGNGKGSHGRSRNKECTDAKRSVKKGDEGRSLSGRDHHSKDAVTPSCGAKLQKFCSSMESLGKLRDVVKKSLPVQSERSSSVPDKDDKKGCLVPAMRGSHSGCGVESFADHPKSVLDHPSILKAEDENVLASSADKEKLETEAEEEEDGVCCDVCREADADERDPIVFCDGCDVMVHASCYGAPLIEGVPEGDWFCNQCKEGKGKECCLCPNKGGAMKETTKEGVWAHLSCSLFVPEVFYKNAREREGIECGKVPAWRWHLPCLLCNSSSSASNVKAAGACIQCTEVGCSATFHVSCAMDAGLSLDIRVANSFTPAIVIAFCPTHSDQSLSTSERRRFKIVPRD